jgi:ribosomal protein S3AE
MSKAPAKAVNIVKKKRWVAILAPKLFNEQLLGESYVEEPSNLVGRCVSVSLMTLTGDPQKQNVSVSFKIVAVQNDMVTTELTGYKLLPAAAKKMMRRKRNKIEDSFIVESADKKIIRVKPLIVTRGNTTGSVLATMQKLERAFIAKLISQSDVDSLIRDIVQKKLQSSLSQLLRRLYPVGACEIRMLEVIPVEKVKELGLKITLPPDKLPEIKAPKRREEQIQSEQPVDQASEQPLQA